jgi:methionyl aminopeptidase
MIILKTYSQVECIRKSCKIVSYVLNELRKEIQPGVTSIYLNNLAEELCCSRGGTPGFKGYKGFPYSICASKNSEIIHGFPNNTPLVDGDVISIDFGVLYKGWWGDSAFTVGVGKTSHSTDRIIRVGEECLKEGIKNTKPFKRIGDISFSIQKHAEKNGYDVVREFVGHGVGKNLHEDPQIPNFGEEYSGHLIRPGTVIAIEPMITDGSCEHTVLDNGWTAVTKSGKLSVHFEHTVVVLSDRVEILTSF